MYNAANLKTRLAAFLQYNSKKHCGSVSFGLRLDRLQ